MVQSDRSQGPHPPAQRLRDFAQGRSSLEEIAAIEAHLLGCPPCCTALEDLPEDGLESLIRAAGSSTHRDAAEDAPPSGPPPPPDAYAGRPHVPGYEVLEELGRGGMGVVYKARQVGLDRTVALKMLLAGAHADVALLARFRAEGEAVARLRHPNVVQVYDTGTVDGLPYFALEYVEAGSLAGHLRGTPRPPGEAAAFLERLARATAAAHREGIIHRDLKPDNVLLASEPGREPGPTLAGFVPKIADFGLAKWAEHGDGLTRTGMLVGTPAYMAPEQAAGDHEGIGPATDVYSLGAILYELLTGRPPFRGSTSLDTLDQVRHADPVPPGRLVPRLPRDLETICLKCLEKEPARRYDGADALGDDLARFRRGEPIVARPIGAPGRAWKWARRRPSLAALLATTAAALVGGTGVSTYFAVEAGLRAEEARGAEGKAIALADERQKSLIAARLARGESDRRAAELLFREGMAQCESGAVALGLYTLLDAWRAAPEEDADFRRVVRTNLAAWRWQLPRLRGVAPNPGPGRFWPVALDDGATFLLRGNGAVQLWRVEDVTPVGPPSPARPGETIKDAFRDGTLLCFADGRHYFRKPDGTPLDDVPLPDWANRLEDFAIERRGPDSPDLVFQGPRRDETFLRIWPLLQEEKGPVCVPSGGELSYRVARDRADRDVLVAFRRQPTGGAGEELELWDLGTGARLSGFEPPAGAGDPAVTWDGRSLLTVSTLRGTHRLWPSGQDGSVRWWDPKTGRPLGTPWQPRRVALHAELGRDHATLASWCRDSRVRLYDLGTGLQRGGDLLPKLDIDAGWTPAFTLSPDGGTLLVGDRLREVHAWDVRHVRLQAGAASSPRFPQSRPEGAMEGSKVAFSPDGSAALFCPRPQWHFGALVDVATGLPIGRPLSQDLAFHPVFSADGRLAATLSDNVPFGGEPIARVWDAATGEPHTPPLHNPKYLHCAAFSPDARVLALGGPGGTHLWDVPSASLLRPLPEASTASRLRFSDDGGRLAVGYRSGWPGVGAGLRLWDPRTGEPVADFVPAEGNITHLAFADGGKTVLALALGRRLYTVDAATGRPRGAVLSLVGSGPAAVASDGSRVATADHGGTVRQWDPRTGAQLGGAMAHPTRVVSLHYSPSGGGLLASVCEDESVRLWDARACLPLGPPFVHRSPVLAAEFGPDGRSLRTATASGGVHTWPVAEPVSDDPNRFALWVEAFGGMRRQEVEVILLGVEPWRRAVADLASRWDTPDPALTIPEDQAAWHEARAADAEEDANAAAALLHLVRLTQLQPRAWTYHARLGRALSEVGMLEQAAAAYDKADVLAPQEIRNWYRHRIAILGNEGQRDAAVNWYEDRLLSTEAGGN